MCILYIPSISPILRNEGGTLVGSSGLAFYYSLQTKEEGSIKFLSEFQNAGLGLNGLWRELDRLRLRSSRGSTFTRSKVSGFLFLIDYNILSKVSYFFQYFWWWLLHCSGHRVLTNFAILLNILLLLRSSLSSKDFRFYTIKSMNLLSSSQVQFPLLLVLYIRFFFFFNRSIFSLFTHQLFQWLMPLLLYDCASNSDQSYLFFLPQCYKPDSFGSISSLFKTILQST